MTDYHRYSDFKYLERTIEKSGLEQNKSSGISLTKECYPRS
jgi:hypothetical protein